MAEQQQQLDLSALDEAVLQYRLSTPTPPSFPFAPGFQLDYRHTFLVVETSGGGSYAAGWPGAGSKSPDRALLAQNDMFPVMYFGCVFDVFNAFSMYFICVFDVFHVLLMHFNAFLMYFMRYVFLCVFDVFHVLLIYFYVFLVYFHMF